MWFDWFLIKKPCTFHGLIYGVSRKYLGSIPDFPLHIKFKSAIKKIITVTINTGLVIQLY